MLADVDRSDFLQSPSRRDDWSLHCFGGLRFLVTALALGASLGRHVELPGQEGQAELVATTALQAEEGPVRLLADLPDFAALHLELWPHDRVKQLVYKRFVHEQGGVEKPLQPAHRAHVGLAHSASSDSE